MNTRIAGLYYYAQKVVFAAVFSLPSRVLNQDLGSDYHGLSFEHLKTFISKT